MDHYNFYMGQEFEAYQYLGAHRSGDGVVFRTFAPNAAKVSVIGTFNDWQETAMQKVYDGNFWECEISDAKPGMAYKYRIYERGGRCIDHCDPYGFGAELRPGTASVIRGLNDYTFRDDVWQQQRSDMLHQPLHIYEFHFGSWKRKSEAQDDWYSYRELAELLIPYVKEHGYNYIEIMPLNEYPCDQSWGYQGTGFFSPTSRYGTPDELRDFIDRCHQNEIGVLLDFIPVHFAVNDYALLNYDGTALYEYPHHDVGRSEWGSCNFMHSRGEVRSFLQSSAYFWLKEFHFDGLRMDAVSNLIYWQGDARRGENRPAIQFLQNMNRGIKERIPASLLIAEDSSTYPGVTKSTFAGGLGFDYKWCLGWMNDTLSYFQMPPEQRAKQYHKLTFSMHYFYNENYLLPLSHDEVVHGKGTILQKMNGDYEAKFPQARALYLYMLAHPGKKLNFMGNELGQFREWDENREQDWELLSYPKHDAFKRYMRDLNKIYLVNPALSEQDYEKDGFVWLDCQQEAYCIYAFERRSKSQRIAVVFNLSDQEIKEYQLNISNAASLELLIASDAEEYGGCRQYSQKVWQVKGDKARLDLSPFSGICFEVK